ncbi:MAG: hypothetical protein AABX54_03680 [Nanoarchaeota archaeon]
MLRLSYWERGKRPEGALGIEISESSLSLAGRLDERFCGSEVSIQGNTYEHRVHGGIIKIVHKQSPERGMHADIELRGETSLIIEQLALKTDLPYADREVEKIDG